MSCPSDVTALTRAAFGMRGTPGCDSLPGLRWRMAWFLFIDESGQDHKESPYEVLAGVAIEDSNLWNLIKELHDAEIAHFGRRYSDGPRELKGKKILKRKTFARARTEHPVLPNEVPALAKAILDAGVQN